MPSLPRQLDAKCHRDIDATLLSTNSVECEYTNVLSVLRSVPSHWSYTGDREWAVRSSVEVWTAHMRRVVYRKMATSNALTSRLTFRRVTHTAGRMSNSEWTVCYICGSRYWIRCHIDMNALYMCDHAPEYDWGSCMLEVSLSRAENVRMVVVEHGCLNRPRIKTEYVYRSNLCHPQWLGNGTRVVHTRCCRSEPAMASASCIP